MPINEKEPIMPTYTILQLAKELQVSIPTVRRWIKAGKVNVLRLGHRTVRITDEELGRIKRDGLI
jgi:excisionase family DNA binding protein